MPIDLMLIADAADRRCEVEVLDGSILTLDQIMAAIAPDVACVGFSYTALSAKSLRILAAHCKSQGAVTVAGGHAATGSAAYLAGCDLIDIVCAGDGRPFFGALTSQLAVHDFAPELLPNAVFVDASGTLRRTRAISEDVWNQIVPNRTTGNLDPSDYLRRYPDSRTLIQMRGTKACNTFSKRGCPQACSFCARQDRTLRLRRPDVVAGEIAALTERYGVDYMLDTSDTWVHVGWSEAFAEERRKRGIDEVAMMCFVDPRHVTSRTCKLLSACGVDSVLLGVESGSDRILSSNMKGTTTRGTVDAVTALLEQGIRVSCSFVFGLVGEDGESIEETIDYAERLRKLGDVICYGNVIIPLMGSGIWEVAFPSARVWPRCITDPLHYDLAAVRELYVESGTKVSGGVAALHSACQRMLESNQLAVLEYAR